MKRITRSEVWETNSSSIHTLTFCGESSMHYDMDVEQDGYVHSHFDNYGWDGEPLDDMYRRLSYILTMAAMIERRNKTYYDEESFYQTESFKMIEDVVKEHVDCKGIIIDYNGIEMYQDEYGEYVAFNGFIDHQSCEDYNSLDDFLKDSDAGSIERFIFDDSIVMIIDNDNH